MRDYVSMRAKEEGEDDAFETKAKWQDMGKSDVRLDNVIGAFLVYNADRNHS